jgi:CRP/FNR family transcriptional regulator, cyclic AMP receptor protein
MDDAFPLHSLPLFRNVPPAHLEPLVQATSRITYAPGAPIFRQGDIPKYLYIIEHGSVDIVLPAVVDDIIVATFESGTVFGELGVFDNQPRTATARASGETTTTVISIPLAVVANLVESHPPAAKQFMSVIIERLRSTDEMLSRLKIRNVNEIADEKMTFGERVADLVARFGGSWTFIIAFGVFLAIWMAVNTVWILTQPPDPFPYIFLNLILSCLAALQAPVIMMSQNRQASKDRLQADQDYQVNIKAEFAIQQLHRKLDDMRASLAQHRRAEAEHWRNLEKP